MRTLIKEMREYIATVRSEKLKVFKALADQMYSEHTNSFYVNPPKFYCQDLISTYDAAPLNFECNSYMVSIDNFIPSKET